MDERNFWKNTYIGAMIRCIIIVGMWASTILVFNIMYPTDTENKTFLVDEKGNIHNIIVDNISNSINSILYEREVDFRKGPYLQNVNKTSITISWETTEPTTATVYYGKSESLEFCINVSNSDTFHEVRIDALEPNTMYYYMVDIGPIQSPVLTFYTAPEPWDSFRVIFYGDSRSNPSVHNTLSNLMLQEQPRLVFNTGDLVEDGNVDSQWDEMHFTPARTLMMFVPMYPCLGNHERHGEPYFKYFQLPGDGGEERWYSFDFGNIHFIAMSSEDPYLPGSEQYAWLESDLQNASDQGKWIIGYWHVPPYNTGVSHGTGNPTDDPEGTDMRDTVCALFEQYGAKFVFNGHEHIYQHSFVNNVHYVITGGGGAFLSFYGGPHDWTVVCSDRSYHYVILDFTPFTVNVTVKRINGTIIEQYSESIPVVDYPPEPPTQFMGYDTPFDNGGSITLEWERSRDDGDGWRDITHYEILRADGAPTDFYTISMVPKGTTMYVDSIQIVNQADYYYKIRVWDKGGQYAETEIVGPVKALDNTPPLPPPSIEVTDRKGDNGGALIVSWERSPSTDVVSYYLFRSVTEYIANTSQPIAVLSSATTEYLDENVSDDTDYYYAIAAYDGTYISPLSDIFGPVHSVWDGAPSPPTITSVYDKPDDSGGAIVIEWQASKDDGPEGDVESYSILRKSEFEAKYLEIAIVPKGTYQYIDNSCENSVGYFYIVRAFDGYLYSMNSNIYGPVYALDNTIPDCIEDAKIEGIGDTWVKLRWYQNQDGITTKYRIYINGSGSTIPNELTLEIPHKDSTVYNSGEVTGLAPSTRYYFVVVAVSKYDKEAPYTEDDILIADTLNPPVITEVVVTPEIVGNSGEDSIVIKAKVDDGDGLQDIVHVYADLTALGYTHSESMNDNGVDGDETKGDGWYSLRTRIKMNTKPNEYSFTIVAMDSMGLEYTATGKIKVVDAELLKNHRPEITAKSPEDTVVTIYLGQKITFSVDVNDIDDNLRHVKWFIDGRYIDTTNRIEYTFGRPGEHKVVVIATDEEGKTASEAWTINVIDTAGDGELDEKDHSKEKTSAEKGTNDGYYIPVTVVLIVITLTAVFIYLRQRKQKGV